MAVPLGPITLRDRKAWMDENMEVTFPAKFCMTTPVIWDSRVFLGTPKHNGITGENGDGVFF